LPALCQKQYRLLRPIEAVPANSGEASSELRQFCQGAAERASQSAHSLPSNGKSAQPSWTDFPCTAFPHGLEHSPCKSIARPRNRQMGHTEDSLPRTICFSFTLRKFFRFRLNITLAFVPFLLVFRSCNYLQYPCKMLQHPSHPIRATETSSQKETSSLNSQVIIGEDVKPDQE
jgi:hypothetical protein